MGEIFKNCPHISFTAYGVYACSLYNPYDKNCIVQRGTCAGNTYCPYKHNFGTEINFGTRSKSYPSKCYSCSKRVVVGGVAMCIDDIESTDHSDTQCTHQDDP